MTNLELSPLTTYYQYLQWIGTDVNVEVCSGIQQILEQTNWDEPETPLDWNNMAVIALIEASQCEEPAIRALYFEMAVAALENGVDTNPLCAAHRAIAHLMIGEKEDAFQLGFSSFMNVLPP
jgi:hypothetical protein